MVNISTEETISVTVKSNGESSNRNAVWTRGRQRAKQGRYPLTHTPGTQPQPRGGEPATFKFNRIT